MFQLSQNKSLFRSKLIFRNDPHSELKATRKSRIADQETRHINTHISLRDYKTVFIIAFSVRCHRSKRLGDILPLNHFSIATVYNFASCFRNTGGTNDGNRRTRRRIRGQRGGWELDGRWVSAIFLLLFGSRYFLLSVLFITASPLDTVISLSHPTRGLLDMERENPLDLFGIRVFLFFCQLSESWVWCVYP